ncbi:enediyne antibiotic chromoprotein [Micromonospora lutea]|uniref:enediyne antibiotic chromoprotein n=1 Tax=Micromonospora lutea TaxID=419825 RepID=UPI001951C6B1|nr:enediyne antibiotic chromoprotein [Micromonospora lutea]
MFVRNWKRTLSALGVGAVLALGLTLTGSAPAASAPTKPGEAPAAATVTVTPATGLADGQVVTVDAAGLRPSTIFHIGQCAIVGAEMPCNGAETISVSTTASGTLSVKLAVRLVYRGTLGPDGTPWGVVHCGRTPCGIGMFNNLGEGAGAAISFR